MKEKTDMPRTENTRVPCRNVHWSAVEVAQVCKHGSFPFHQWLPGAHCHIALVTGRAWLLCPDHIHFVSLPLPFPPTFNQSLIQMPLNLPLLVLPGYTVWNKV